MPRATLLTIVPIILTILSNINVTKVSRFYQELLSNINSCWSYSSSSAAKHRYWNTENRNKGMFGKFHEKFNESDIWGSRVFLSTFHVRTRKLPPGTARALVCGTGLDRAAKHVLLDRFDKVDLLEPKPKTLDAAKQYINDTKLGSLYLTSLKEFRPRNKYDVIWMQYVLQYIEEYDMLYIMDKLKSCLSFNGVIIVKECASPKDDTENLTVEQSYMRPMEVMKELFENEQLKPVTVVRQNAGDFTYPVYLYALRPVM